MKKFNEIAAAGTRYVAVATLVMPTLMGCAAMVANQSQSMVTQTQNSVETFRMCTEGSSDPVVAAARQRAEQIEQELASAETRANRAARDLDDLLPDQRAADQQLAEATAYREALRHAALFYSSNVFAQVGMGYELQRLLGGYDEYPRDQLAGSQDRPFSVDDWAAVARTAGLIGSALTAGAASLLVEVAVILGRESAEERAEGFRENQADAARDMSLELADIADLMADFPQFASDAALAEISATRLVLDGLVSDYAENGVHLVDADIARRALQSGLTTAQVASMIEAEKAAYLEAYWQQVFDMLHLIGRLTETADRSVATAQSNLSAVTARTQEATTRQNAANQEIAALRDEARQLERMCSTEVLTNSETNTTLYENSSDGV